jgi:dynamin 1-like protein
MNGNTGPEDEDPDDFLDDGASAAGASARSVSSTVHDRTRISVSTAAGTISKASSRLEARSAHAHMQRPASAAPAPGSSPPSTAKDTFLNYFFGQNGPGPVAGSSFERAAAGVGAMTGRDVHGGDAILHSGLLAPRRDGSTAAYDMKSLGKHIEAVSVAHLAPHTRVGCSRSCRRQ